LRGGTGGIRPAFLPWSKCSPQFTHNPNLPKEWGRIQIAKGFYQGEPHATRQLKGVVLPQITRKMAIVYQFGEIVSQPRHYRSAWQQSCR
jgi:hypothetical protein